ncbi:Transcription factor [Mycoemilia scoparia]|uniref:Transcription factor n=1 Tax=Mycoemilia scoparia TaxID=417184 RepID=A0A9W8DJL0_9FUNG|nr:Transcription factor [Mycoemilia scoparia]
MVRQQLLLEQQQQQQQQLHDDSTSVTTSKDGEISITDRFFFTAADPSDGSSEDKIRQYISAKFQAGFLKPYNYVNGYSRMQHFMETNMSQPSIIRILTTLETFRPTFRAIAQSLRDFDLLLVEEGFERMLLDYDHVFNSFGTPACLWRRTGEIYKANREFADLVGIPLHYFRDGRIGIYELLTEDSTVNYWEQYGKIAFDTSQKAVLTSCVLQCSVGLKERVQHDELSASSGGGGNNNNNNSGGGGGGNFGSPRKLSSSGAGGGNGNYNNHHNHHHNYPHPHPHHGVSSPSASSVTSSSLLLGRGIRCCFSFTIRRDKYKIPVAIIGNFMPTKPKDIQRQIIES